MSSVGCDDTFPEPLETRPAIRAAFLRWLATDELAAQQIDPVGIRVANSTFSEPLDLDYCSISFPLRFAFCTFQEAVSFREARLPALVLISCTSRRTITADGVAIAGDLNLRNLECDELVGLSNAEIGGNLDCDGATLKGTDTSLKTDGARIHG
jgi:hypothetical protein